MNIKKKLKIIMLVSLSIIILNNICFAAMNYTEFSKKILKNDVYEKYKSEADNGDIEAIILQISNEPSIHKDKYIELNQRILKPKIYSELEKQAYESYDKYVKPLPRMKDNNEIEIIDIQTTRQMSVNSEISAFRQAYIAGMISIMKQQYEDDYNKK